MKKLNIPEKANHNENKKGASGSNNKHVLFHKKYETSDERRSAKRAAQLSKQNVRREARVVKYGSDSVGAVVADFNKRFVAAFMALVFALSCLVIGVNFATKADDETASNGNIVTSKNLSFNATTGKYDLALEAYATGKTTETPTALDIALVIDQSGSMTTGDMGESYDPATITNWTVSAATSEEQYYYRIVEDGVAHYYPVKAREGLLYEEASSIYIFDLLANHHYGIVSWGSPLWYNIRTINSDKTSSYYYPDSNGVMHKVYAISVGDFNDYSIYLYYYLDPYYNGVNYEEADEWNVQSNAWTNVLGDRRMPRERLLDSLVWKNLVNNNKVAYVGTSDGTTTSAESTTRHAYKWFQDGDAVTGLYLPVTNKTTYNEIYYVDSDGNEQPLPNSKTAYTANDIVYSGTLYKASGTTRLEALQEAVSDFTKAVGENAKENDVDHRIAVVGFAGNQTPSYSTIGGRYSYSGKNRSYDYVNTGLFIEGGFKNYEEITGYDSGISSSPSLNFHYYVGSGTSKTPVKRNSNGTWYTVSTAETSNSDGTYTAGSRSTYSQTISSSNKFYRPVYEDLQSSDYKKALVSVNANDAGYFDTESEENASSYHTFVSDSSKTNGVNDYIDKAISQFGDYGGTYTSYGISMANKVFDANPISQDENRERIIIVFTDGEPGGSGYDEAIANEALSDGQTSKDTYGATVYTIGLFKTTPSEDVDDFMNELSSKGSVTKNPVYAGSSYGPSGDLDGSKTYYYTEDGKTYSVKAIRNGSSSLGWWYTYQGTTSDSYSYFLPYANTSDERTTRNQFYEKNGNTYSKVYSGDNDDQLDTSKTYYALDSGYYYPVKWEYRWYNSDNYIVDPKTSSDDRTARRKDFFEITGAEVTGSDNIYYQTASTVSELNSAFTNITESISGTTLDETAILKDVINTTNFTLPNDLTADGVVTVYTSKGSQDTENGSIGGWTTPVDITEDVTVEWGADKKTLSVSGFDYSKNYIAYGKAAIDNDTVANQGRKLIVKISGLTPKETGEALTSNSSAGIYTPDESGGDDTLVASFDSPSLDRFPVTMHVGDEDSTLTFNTKLALAANENVTANFDQIIVNNDSSRATYSNSVSDGSITWGGTVGNNNVIYLEYIRNPSNETKASDYTLGTTITPNDTVSYTYQYALEENGTPQDLPSTQISLGTAAAEKNIYITSEATSKDVVITESTTGTYADTSRAFPITLTLKDKDSNNVFGTYSYELGDGTTGSVTFTNGTGTISLSNGQTATLKALPYNATLTVEPTAATYYTQSVELDSSSDTSKTATINTDGITFNVNYVRKDVTDSGILDNTNPISKWMFIIAGVLAVLAIVFAVWQKRKKNLTE